MTQYYAWPVGDGDALYLERLFVGSTMVLCIVRAMLAIRRPQFVLHGLWMIRAYAIVLVRVRRR